MKFPDPAPPTAVRAFRSFNRKGVKSELLPIIRTEKSETRLWGVFYASSSKLSQAQREQAVVLFEQGYGARAVSNPLVSYASLGLSSPDAAALLSPSSPSSGEQHMSCQRT